MATQYVMGTDGAKMPDGIVLAHTLHGEPDRTVTHAHTANAAHGVAVVPVGDDGIAYKGDPRYELVVPVPVPEQGGSDESEDKPDRSKRCVANNNTCNGWRIKDSDLCSGHAGKLRRPSGGPP